MNTYEVKVTDRIDVMAVVKMVAATEEEAIAKGHAHLKAIQLAAPELYEACEAQVKVVAHFAHCERGCQFRGERISHCSEWKRLNHNATCLIQAAVKKVRAAT